MKKVELKCFSILKNFIVLKLYFFNEHRKLYWLAAVFRVFSTDNKGKNPADFLYNTLNEQGLSKKGWIFLIKQSEHYITRFAQNVNVGIFFVQISILRMHSLEMKK